MNRSMRPLTALFVVLSLATSALGAGLLHVHEAIEHAHTAHHQGVAAHTHIRVTAPDDQLRLESCDTAVHLRMLSFTSVEAPAPLVLCAPETLDALPVVLAAGANIRPVQECRAHGPPNTAIGLRAPPILPAV